MLTKVYSWITILVIAALLGISSPLVPVTADSTYQASSENVPESSLSLRILSTNIVDSNSSISSIKTDDFSYAVVQQPSGYAAYVSTDVDKVTQFGMASSYGSIGMIAHNNLAGARFSLLQVGDTITLVYGDGSARKFTVTQIKQYQALSPTSPYSEFVSLSDSSTITATQLFMDTYGQSGHLVLQTCIAKDGVSSWGRLFIIASPAS
jgi:hypothetical protein